jgi:type II secretion system protein G
MNRKKGFTLIELLVVIAIIGVLSSVVLASLNSARQKSRDAKRVSDIKQLQLALELFFDRYGHYPAAALDVNDPTEGQTIESAGFIAAIPTDPVSGNQYNYAWNLVAATDYHLGAGLEDPLHTVLNSDVDCSSIVADCFPAGAAGGGFNGAGAQPNGDDATTPIYDVTP